MARTGKKKTKLDRLNEVFLEACAAGDAELAHTTAETILDLLAKEEVELPNVPQKQIVWNTDPVWVEYCEKTLERFVKSIAYKSTTDEDLREDCENEARMVIYQLGPTKVRGYAEYKAGEISESKWRLRVLNYCKNAIRNTVLSYLDSPKTGNWNIGRTNRVRTRDGRRIKVHAPARHVSLEELSAYGFQVNEQGESTWAPGKGIVGNNTVSQNYEEGDRDSLMYPWPMEEDNNE